MKKIILFFLLSIGTVAGHAQNIYGESVILGDGNPMVVPVTLKGYNRAYQPVPLNMEFTYDQENEILRLAVVSDYKRPVNMIPYSAVWIPCDNIRYVDLKSYFKEHYHYKISIGKQMKKHARRYGRNWYRIVPSISSQGCMLHKINGETVTGMQEKKLYTVSLDKSETFVLEFLVSQDVNEISIKFANLIPLVQDYKFVSGLSKGQLQYVAEDIEVNLKIRRGICDKQSQNINEVNSRMGLLKEKRNLLHEKNALTYGSPLEFEELKQSILSEFRAEEIENKYAGSECTDLNKSIKAYRTLYDEIALMECSVNSPCTHPENAVLLGEIQENMTGLQTAYQDMLSAGRRGRTEECETNRRIIKRFEAIEYNYEHLIAPELYCREVMDLALAFDSLKREALRIKCNGVGGEVPCALDIVEINEAAKKINRLIDQWIINKISGVECKNNANILIKNMDEKIRRAPASCKRQKEIQEAIETYNEMKRFFNDTVK